MPMSPPVAQQTTSESLHCKFCSKPFPRFDQRGYKNAGFSSHQNHCYEKAQPRESSVDEPTVKTPRPILPASISPSSSMPTADELLNTPNVAMDRSIIFSPCSVFQITQCNYCSPESGLHNPSCHEIKDIVAVGQDY